MNRELVFVHGRAQEGLAPLEEKLKWIGYLKEGLAKSNLTMPIEESAVHFPFYGNTLVQLVAGLPKEKVAKVIQKGYGDDESAKAFLEEVVLELQQKVQLSPAELLAASPDGDVSAIEKGFQNTQLVLSILRALDKHAPWASSGAIALATHDVYRYLNSDYISGPIDDGVLAAVKPGVETVIVAHSLGSIIAYKLLRDRAQDTGWKIPHFITVGSPLGIGTIKSALKKIRYPAVGAWSNAYDPNDVVALRSLEKKWFNVTPEITNLEVKNNTENKHGISGYLSDKQIALWIYEALTKP